MADDNRADSDADETDGRDETRNERSDRNWSEILQELRVTQTGTQIISGFLLTLAFQQRFSSVTTYERTVYLVLIALAAVTTAVGLAPVSLHRTLFRRHEKPEIVSIASRLLDIDLVLVSLLTGGVVLFIFTFVLNVGAGIVASALVFVLLAILLVVIPRSAARRSR
jgi:Family of unknown function (DUF6328)